MIPAADVRHVQSDTTDIKAELRVTNQRLDLLKDSLASAKVWALGLYIALAGSLLYVLARGFKWF
jgi:hypothetical protein